MPKYLYQVSYTTDGLKGVLREGGSSRRATIDQLITSMGGTMESFHYAFGDHDVYLIADLPDNETSAAIALAVNAAGAAKVSTTVLISPEEVDRATKKTVNYRPPGAQ